MNRAATALLLAFSFVTAATCGGSNDPSSDPGPAADYTADEQRVSAAVDADLAKLSRGVGALARQQPWYAGGRTAPEFVELLDATGSYYRAASPDEVQALWARYPSGMQPGTLELLRTLVATAPVRKVLASNWVTDGIDAYEKAVLGAARMYATTPSAVWLLALEQGAFRSAYDSDAASFDASILNPLSHLSRSVLDYAAGQDWFQDGLDTGDASLLVTVSQFTTEDDQLDTLRNRSYVLVNLARTKTAVVVKGAQAGTTLAKGAQLADTMRRVEAVWGAWPFNGVLIETVALDSACHGASVTSSVYLARLWLTTTSTSNADFCFSTGVIAHEITHSYFGSQFPGWFTEGIAELGQLYVTGARTGGYVLPNSTSIRIDRGDVKRSASDPRYRDQAAAGADFLLRVNSVLGRDRMVQAMLPLKRAHLSTDQLLAVLKSAAPPDSQPALQSLIDWFFDGLGRAPPPLPR
jgi:hypothetical protein